MKVFAKLSVVALAAAAFAPLSFADGRTPGSVLIYPIHRSGDSPSDGDSSIYFTVVSVTNTNLVPVFGGIPSTNVQYEYVNTVYNPDFPLKPLHCFVVDRVEALTPADTLSVLTSCHNAADGQEGYLVITAQDPSLFKTAWSFNHLVGSEMVVTSLGGVYGLNAIPFASPQPEAAATDLDGDGELDFDGAEYEGVPDVLYIDAFKAIEGSSLSLINLTGGTQFQANVRFDIWNDNEFPLSAVVGFKCWFEEELTTVSTVFDGDYLYQNTPHDDSELDIFGCDGVGDVETGWAMITGINASSSVESIPDPALLGAITAGGEEFFDGGRLLWESVDKQFNGDFLKFGTDDPEH